MSTPDDQGVTQGDPEGTMSDFLTYAELFTTPRLARLHVDTEHGEVVATPVLIDAIGRQLDTEDIRVFVDRQGIAKLAAALQYTRRVMAVDITQRTAANKLGVHPVEGMTVITALQDVIEDAAAYDPYLDVPE